ncbi:PepSY-associated TM helix domain-containing protein [Bradyrhizobium prioriisuperbiae]|uniref:PepSY-associated TM helix domain-containing protein n=1 Tax=Bradyrhizobium prioriisuperbiae TaxID=2854389 RepID=UPI0028EB2DB0|nr:PepSY-associated TM helix domain-containing protein [Bradyrhizobium prioritasuperba]
MTPRAVGIWKSVHTWTSLVCTLFLFVLCLTGLPLIFQEDLDRAFGQRAVPDQAPVSAPLLPVDQLIAIARAERPNEVVRFATKVDDAPLWNMEMGTSIDSMKLTSLVTIDARTGKIMRVGQRLRSPVIQFIKDLHTELLLSQPGELFLCAIGLCFLAAIASGVVVYGPFMRRLDFGTVRAARAPRLKWLDLHNLTGIAVTLWLLVVGVTGVINTLSKQVANRWMRTELAEMIGPWRNAPPLDKVIPAQLAIETALRAAPGMEVATVAMPGSMFAGRHHYNVFLSGNEPLTSKLIMPVLINAADGTLTEKRSLPLYAQVLFLSKPLHFGDYGGMPLKIIWALLDLITLIVLGSGLYLWAAQRWPSRARSAVAVEQTLIPQPVEHRP